MIFISIIIIIIELWFCNFHRLPWYCCCCCCSCSFGFQGWTILGKGSHSFCCLFVCLFVCWDLCRSCQVSQSVIYLFLYFRFLISGCLFVFFCFLPRRENCPIRESIRLGLEDGQKLLSIGGKKVGIGHKRENERERERERENERERERERERTSDRLRCPFFSLPKRIDCDPMPLP